MLSPDCDGLRCLGHSTNLLFVVTNCRRRHDIYPEQCECLGTWQTSPTLRSTRGSTRREAPSPCSAFKGGRVRPRQLMRVIQPAISSELIWFTIQRDPALTADQRVGDRDDGAFAAGTNLDAFVFVPHRRVLFDARRQPAWMSTGRAPSTFPWRVMRPIRNVVSRIVLSGRQSHVGRQRVGILGAGLHPATTWPHSSIAETQPTPGIDVRIAARSRYVSVLAPGHAATGSVRPDRLRQFVILPQDGGHRFPAHTGRQCHVRTTPIFRNWQDQRHSTEFVRARYTPIIPHVHLRYAVAHEPGRSSPAGGVATNLTVGRALWSTSSTPMDPRSTRSELVRQLRAVGPVRPEHGARSDWGPGSIGVNVVYRNPSLSLEGRIARIRNSVLSDLDINRSGLPGRMGVRALGRSGRSTSEDYGRCPWNTSSARPVSIENGHVPLDLMHDRVPTKRSMPHHRFSGIPCDHEPPCESVCYGDFVKVVLSTS